jgi:zinc protease
MRRTLFGNTGYGLDAMGVEESVQQLTVETVRHFFAQYTVPNDCVLAIYGDIDTQAVRDAVEKAFGDWKPSPETHRPGSFSVSEPLVALRRVTESRDKKQAVIVVGFRGVTLYDPDRYPLELLQEACSDLGSRLFLRVREQLGLAYYVGAQNFTGLLPGYVAFYAGTMPEKAELVEKELLQEAEVLCVEGLSEPELNRAKAKVIGQKKIARQDLGAYALSNALDELYGLGYNYSETEDKLYESVTLEAVKSAARKYLRSNACVIATVAPPAQGQVVV